MTKPLRGNDLLRAVVDQITNHPETWDQEYYHCGSTHCVAGWAQILGAKRECHESCRTDATQLLGLNYFEANYLFDVIRTLDEIKEFAQDRSDDRKGE